MPHPSIITSAPGSLMLLGEHAILHGRRALVAAVNQRLRVTLTPHDDNRVEIDSALGHHKTTLREIAPHPSFRFILEAVRREKDALPTGIHIRIESEFSHTIGFGSSAAVAVATIAALRRACGLDVEPDAVCREAICVIRAVQGRGSGADAVASTYGGVVCYRAQPFETRAFAWAPALIAVYSGYKTPTPEVIRRVEAHWAGQPAAQNELYDRMDRCVALGIDALEQRDTAALGAAINLGQSLMDDLGVNTPELAAIIDALRADPGIYGAKISGSGLGDCAVGIGRIRGSLEGFSAIPVAASTTGLRMENE